MDYLKIKNLSFNYGKKNILNDINLNVDKGEVISLVGPSGCGKSTLLRTIIGLEEIQRGEIELDGKIISSKKVNIPIDKRGMGIVFQNPSLFPHITAEDNIFFGIKKKKNREIYDNRKSISENYLKLFDLPDIGDKYPHELSGGEQQRVSLVRTLVSNPDIILLDEPFANLDSVIRKKIRSNVIDTLREKNITVIIVTHDPQEAMELSDRICILNKGSIIENASACNIYYEPESLFTADFFGSLNEIECSASDNNVTTVFGKKILDVFSDKCKFSISNHIKNSNNNISNFKLYIRPEHITITDKNTKDSLEGKIDKITFFGGTSLVYVKIAGLSKRFRVNNYGMCNLNVGDDIFIKPSYENMLYFDE